MNKMVCGQSGIGQIGTGKMVYGQNGTILYLCTFSFSRIQYKFRNQKSLINNKHIKES